MWNKKTQIYPSLVDYFTMVEQAESTDARTGDSNDFYYAANRALQLNTRLTGNYTRRHSALSSFDWNIKALDKTAGDVAELAVKRINKAIQLVINRHVHTVFNGFSIYRYSTIPTTVGNSLRLSHVKKNNGYFFESESDILYIKQNQQLNAFPLSESPFLVDHDPMSPSPLGLMKAITAVEIMRNDMRNEWANYLKKLKGILQIVSKGATAEEVTNAEKAAQTAIKHNYLITGDDLEFKLNQITGGTGVSFKEYIEMLNSDISIAILGQANTNELPTGGGSRAALQVLQYVSADIFWSDLNRVTRFINDNIVLLDYKLNYDANATEADVPYTFAFDIADEQDTEANANVLQTITPFMPVVKSEAYSKVGYSVPVQGDELLGGPASE